MISKSLRTLLNNKNMAQKQMGLVSAQKRYMGGGKPPPAISSSLTDFDIVCVGGANAAALTKFIQVDTMKYDMAVISQQGKFVLPQAYFGVSHGHLPDLKLESGTISSQVKNWSKCDVGVRVVQYKPKENKLVLSNGKEYTYKALVLAPGFDHSAEHIEGLQEMYDNTPEEDNVFVHQIDNKERVSRNFYHGWNHTHGDMINYSPQGPYKGEGNDFYALYYESFMRQDRLQGRASDSARIQHWTPNKEIFKMPYANEVALDECHKRGIDVMFGWEMTKVHHNSIGEKIATFKNVDSGEVIEHPFRHANINPPSKTWKELVDGDLVDANGLVDVNPYTLQHERFENVFAFGDCIKGDTTRTQHAAHAQNPVVKHNLYQFLEGKELNAVYDGFSYMPFYLSHSNATCFSHTWGYEPAKNNHWVPNYGQFSGFYFSWQMSSNQSQGAKYTSFKQDHGPPHGHFNALYDPLDSNEYLLEKGVDIEALRNIHKKGDLSTA